MAEEEERHKGTLTRKKRRTWKFAPPRVNDCIERVNVLLNGNAHP
jgi:hypothetical protein